MIDVELYRRATDFAAIAHKEQLFPGKPYNYMVHIMGVTMETMLAIADMQKNNEAINCELAILCAILHDVIEDTEYSYDDINKGFGKEVAEGVFALTKDYTLDKDLQMQDSIKRIKALSKEIWIVKLADRITNLYKPPDDRTRERNAAYYDEAIFILNELGSASEFLSKRLRDSIDNYKQYT